MLVPVSSILTTDTLQFRLPGIDSGSACDSAKVQPIREFVLEPVFGIKMEISMKTIVLMKKIVFAFVIGFSACVESASHSATEHGMAGCLQTGSEAGMFVLTDPGMMNGPVTVIIAETDVDIAPHVGHKVEITGTTIAGNDPSAHTMKVTAMKHLAASCP